MSNGGFNPIQGTTAPVAQTKNVQGNPIKQTIGSGDDAKNSFIWLVIRWSFIVGSGISFLVFIRSFFFDEPDSKSLVDTLSNVWSIFIPLITLAIGYAFGKNERSVDSK